MAKNLTLAFVWLIWGLITFEAQMSRAEDTRPMIDAFFFSDPNGGWLTEEELLKQRGSTAVKNRQQAFEQFLLGRIPADATSRASRHADGISMSTPVAQMYLMTNTGRLRAAADAGNAYVRSPISKRFQDPQAIETLIQVHIELGNLAEAEQFIFHQSAKPDVTELPDIWRRIERHGVLAILNGHTELFHSLANPVRKLLVTQADLEPTGDAYLSLGIINAVDGHMVEARTNLNYGLHKLQEFHAQQMERERNATGKLPRMHFGNPRDTTYDVSAANFLVPMLLDAWEDLDRNAKSDFAFNAYNHEAVSGFSESFEVGVPGAEGEMGFFRRSNRQRDAAYQLASRWKPELARPTFEYLLNSRRVRSRSFGRFAFRDRGPFDDLMVEMQGQAAGMQFVLHATAAVDRAQQQADWIRERVSRGLTLPVSDAYLRSVATRTIEDVIDAAPKWKTAQDFANALPAGTVVFEFVKGQTIDFGNLERGFRMTPPVYGAWLLTKAGQPEFFHIGLASEIDPLVYELRERISQSLSALRETGQEDPATLHCLRELSDKLVKPIEPFLADVEHLIVCPDGELWLVPWAGLLMTDDRLLVEKCAISNRFTAGDLVDPPAASRENVGQALIIADPDFNATPEMIRSAEIVALKSEQRDAILVPSINVKRLLPQWSPLPATERESQAIVAPLTRLTGRQPSIYRGRYALESIVKSTHRPEYLHLATHGVYLPREVTPTDRSPSDREFDIPLGFQPLDFSDPLVRSALLLAGTNHCDDWGEIRGSEGILTALEVALLDLRGTKLVVLSACDTGVGDLHIGDGVRGLRQAFIMAGAQSVMASLWKVEDKWTAELMSDFYQHLNEGDSNHVALRKSQLKQLDKCRHLFSGNFPFFWAAFAITGN